MLKSNIAMQYNNPTQRWKLIAIKNIFIYITYRHRILYYSYGRKGNRRKRDYGMGR